MDDSYVSLLVKTKAKDSVAGMNKGRIALPHFAGNRTAILLQTQSGELLLLGDGLNNGSGNSMVKFLQVCLFIAVMTKVNSLSQQFVYQKFSSFYENTEIKSPSAITQREFAFFLLKQRVMVRHKSFVNLSSLKSILCGNVPSDVYHSCAYYENPEADMSKKGWLGSDLVFDIDADHIPTSCNKSHDEWTCKQCGLSGNGVAPERCSNCGGQRLDSKTWPCELCLASAKEETAKLVDMLQNDFGFLDEELGVFFSGHRGYHVHVVSESSKTLDALARKEIVDYITGLGLELCGKGKAPSNRKASSRIFRLHDFGRHIRLRQDLSQFIERATENDLACAGIRSKKAIAAILQYKQQILGRCIEEGLWTSINGVTDETWFKLAEYLTNIESAKIDTVVTTDIHRLIRMDGTLHGKTGLEKVGFPVSRLDAFDPFTEAVAFKDGTAKVFVSNAPEFRLGGKVFGPFRNKTVELPTAAAVLLVCKGRAEVKE